MRTTFLLLITSLVLLSCGGQPSKKPESQTLQGLSKAEQIQILLQQASESPAPDREEFQLKAAALLLEEQQLDLLDQIIQSIETQNLRLRQLAKYAFIVARVDIHRGNYAQALIVLESPRLINEVDNLSLKKQLRLNLLRAEVYALLGSHIASAQQRIYIAPLLDPSEQQSSVPKPKFLIDSAAWPMP